jgi:hypothetical protein
MRGEYTEPFSSYLHRTALSDQFMLVVFHQVKGFAASKKRKCLPPPLDPILYRLVPVPTLLLNN